MPYSHVRFVFYDIYTDPPFRPRGAGVIGWPVDPMEEARTRALNIVNVIRHVARTLPSPSPSDRRKPGFGILNVFMAPEFFFRSSVGRPDGLDHYTLTEVQEARSVIRHAVVSESAFNDWLLVPGTAVYVQYNAVSRKSKLTARVLFNDAWMITRSASGKTEWICQKQNFSTIDWLDRDYRAMAQDGPLAKLAARVHKQVIKLDNLTIGVEICLDHRLGALKRTVAPGALDLHLLPCCGGDAFATKVAARTGGYLLRCNGNDFNPPLNRAYKVAPGTGRAGSPGSSIPTLLEIQPAVTMALPSRLRISTSGRIDGVGFSDLLPLRS
jgi:hypothetical protein